MIYDLPLIAEFSSGLGFTERDLKENSLHIALGEGSTLELINEGSEDCLLGFVGTPWHTHGDLIFSDPNGYYDELNVLDLLSGLKDGLILICELYRNGVLKDRSLAHKRMVHDFHYLHPGEEIRLRRIN